MANSSVAMSTLFTRRSSNADPVLITQYCFVKKELPEELTLKPYTEEGEKGFYVINNGRQAIKFSRVQSEVVPPMPKMEPNQLAVAILQESNVFLNDGDGFYKDTLNKNPLSVGMENETSSGPAGAYQLTFPYMEMNPETLKNPFKIPFNYYHAGKYVENKIIFKPSPRNDYGGVEILNISTTLPLPNGLKLEIQKNPSPFIYNLKQIYDNFRITYKGKEPVFIVKTFANPIESYRFFKDNFYPFFNIYKRTCSRLNGENRFVIKESEYKSYYKKIIDIRNNHEFYKRQKLYFQLPIGYIFPGNGYEERECIIKDFELSNMFSFHSRDNDNKVEELPTQIKIPSDNIASLNMLVDSELKKINVIERQVVNPFWMPAKSNEWKECKNGRAQREVMRKRNLLAKVKTIKEPNLFRESDLICTKEIAINESTCLGGAADF